MDPKNQLLPLAMCAAEVDRHVAQRYLIKRRLGKGVSAGTPGHMRDTAVTFGSDHPPSRSSSSDTPGLESCLLRDYCTSVSIRKLGGTRESLPERQAQEGLSGYIE